jgi:hypothetical protein
VRDRGRGRKPAGLARKVGVKRPRKTFIIFCEGSVSEVAYLEALASTPEVKEAAAVDIKVQSEHGVPMTLVSLAVEAKKNARKSAAEVDEFWCVFDVEWPKRHPNIKEAKQKAESNRIRLAISNPCFEVWLTLHFADCAAPLSTDKAVADRKKCDGSHNKHINPELYMDKRKTAVDRARQLAKRHVSGGSDFPSNNPSSGMYELVAAIDPTTG